VKGEDVVIMSPDVGGIKRAEHFVEALEKLLDKSLSLAFMEKYRSEGKVWGERVVGELKDKVVIIIDDLISTGGTIGRAAEACRQGGARKVLALATHGLFTGKPGEQLSHSILEQVIITNTIPSFRLENDPLMQKIVILDAAPLFAEAIKRSYEGGSIDELLVV
jgi:ribose-phosphate pyrophosphokinase